MTRPTRNLGFRRRVRSNAATTSFAGLALLACTAVDASSPGVDALADGPLAPDAAPRPCRIQGHVFVDSDGGDGDGGDTCGDVPTAIIHETCVGGICHHAGKVQAAHLDLLSPCAADRLVGVTSSCNGRLLVDPEAPERSFILEKLASPTPECGGKQMPYDNHLPLAQLECMRRWVFEIARASR